MFKFLKVRLQQYGKHEFPDVQAGFTKGKGTRDQTATSIGSLEKQESCRKNIYLCFTDYAKAFVWITTNGGKFLKIWEYHTTGPASWEIYMQVKKLQFELYMEQQTGLIWERSTSRLYIVTQLI